MISQWVSPCFHRIIFVLFIFNLRTGWGFSVEKRRHKGQIVRFMFFFFFFLSIMTHNWTKDYILCNLFNWTKHGI